MQIRPNNSQGLPPSARIRPAKKNLKTEAASTADSAAGRVDFDFFDELVEHLSQMPEKREAFLSEARTLLKDPNYPDEQQLKELEKALEIHPENL
ncbi:MAG: hypothetical protein ACLFU4_05215 [Opitutales bacterium]